jgi:hypothetical protein
MFATSDEQERHRHLAAEALDIQPIIPVLTNAAGGLLQAGRALESIASSLAKLTSDAAHGISQTFVLRRYLKDVTEREQDLRRQVAKLAARMPAKRSISKAKSRGRKKRGR